MRPFQFMIGTRGLADPRSVVEAARIAESIGFSHLTIHDHLTPQLAPIPLLTAVAMSTERLGLCPLVFNNDLRHPAVLAQDLATLDLVSAGRLVVVAREHEARTGLTIDPRDVLESPYSLIGSVPDLVDKLRRARERWGINSFLVGWFDDTDVRSLAPVIEQLAGT